MRHANILTPSTTKFTKIRFGDTHTHTLQNTAPEEFSLYLSIKTAGSILSLVCFKRDEKGKFVQSGVSTFWKLFFLQWKGLLPSLSSPHPLPKVEDFADSFLKNKIKLWIHMISSRNSFYSQVLSNQKSFVCSSHSSSWDLWSVSSPTGSILKTWLNPNDFTMSKHMRNILTWNVLLIHNKLFWKFSLPNNFPSNILCKPRCLDINSSLPTHEVSKRFSWVSSYIPVYKGIGSSSSRLQKSTEFPTYN